MPRLRSPRGVVVDVSEETAALLGSTYKPVDGEVAADSPSGEDAEVEKTYEEMTNADLKDLLGQRGLAKSGKHDDLVKRLHDADNEAAVEAEKARQAAEAEDEADNEDEDDESESESN